MWEKKFILRARTWHSLRAEHVRSYHRPTGSSTTCCFEAKLRAVHKSCRKLVKEKLALKTYSCCRNMMNISILWIHSVSLNTWWIGVQWKTADESCSSFLAQLSAAHPASTIVNEFPLTKEGCPAARPHRAPPCSTGPWTRHSKPPFSIFQCGQQPAGFIGVFKSCSLKHSSSASTHSRQFPFYSASFCLHFFSPSLSKLPSCSP